MMAQKIEYREKMKYYNYPLDYMPPEDVKRVIGEDEQCKMCWNPFYYNWCDYCYRPTNEKNVIIIINKPESPLTVKIDAGSSGMQNRDKSGRLEKWKVKNSNFKNKNKRTIKKRKDSQEIEENFQNQSHNCLTSEDIKEVKFGSDNDKEKNQNNKLDEDDNEENVEFPKNQNAENVPKNQNAENAPKNQTAGKKRKINLDEDEYEDEENVEFLQLNKQLLTKWSNKQISGKKRKINLDEDEDEIVGKFNDGSDKENFQNLSDDNDSFIATCHFCEINFHDNDEDSVNKRFLEHYKICKGNNEKKDVEESGKKRKINLDEDEIVGKLNEGSDKENFQNQSDNAFTNEHVKEVADNDNDKEDFCEIIFDGNDEDSVNKRFLEHDKICKGNNEKEDVEEPGKKRKINLDEDEIVGKVNEGSDKEKFQNQSDNAFTNEHVKEVADNDNDKEEKQNNKFEGDKIVGKLYYSVEDGFSVKLVNKYSEGTKEKFHYILKFDEIKKLPISLKQKSKLLKMVLKENPMLFNSSLKHKPVTIDDIEKGYFKCAFCDAIRLGKTALKIHIESKHSNVLSKFDCKNCDYICEDKYTLEQHQLSHHKIISVDLRDIHNANHIYSNRQYKMVSRVQEKMKIKFFKCPYCSENFDDKTAFIAHKKCKHEDSIVLLSAHIDFKSNDDNNENEINSEDVSENESETEFTSVGATADDWFQEIEKEDQISQGIAALSFLDSTNQVNSENEINFGKNDEYNGSKFPEEEALLPLNIEIPSPEGVGNTQQPLSWPSSSVIYHALTFLDATNQDKSENEINFEKNHESNVSKFSEEEEEEALVPLNIETLSPEGVDNTQQLLSRPSSPVDSFFFHKSMRSKHEKFFSFSSIVGVRNSLKKKLFSSIKRKFNLDNENEENVKFPENQTVDKKRKIKLEEDEESVELPKNQTAGKEIKINLDKDEHNASIQAISEGYKCPTCGKSLASKYTLYRHRKDVHKENVMTETVELPKNQTAGKERKINLDEDEHHAQAVSEGYKCPTCGKSLASKYTLFRHRKDVHKENVMTETERQQKNKNCKTSLNKDEKNVEPLTRKYFFV